MVTVGADQPPGVKGGRGGIILGTAGPDLAEVLRNPDRFKIARSVPTGGFLPDSFSLTPEETLRGLGLDPKNDLGLMGALAQLGAAPRPTASNRPHSPEGEATAESDVAELENSERPHGVRPPIAGAAPALETSNNALVQPAAISRERLATQRAYQKAIDPNGLVVGSSPAMLEVFEHIHDANMVDGPAAVLILGERGTGKTHIAKLLHDSSSRASCDFVERNAGGGGGDLNIQRGEWIGYGKGHAIQGIDRSGRAGHLMNADRGTLFVDELAELSSSLQVIFLSVLEGRAIEKVGGESFVPDVRCIFATNADVEAILANGTLRRDLYDRIAVRIRIPPLRDRRGDILLLAKHFAGEHRVADQCLVALLRHDWPGNVRGLQKAMQTAIARKRSADAPAVELAHVELPAAVRSTAEALGEDACRRELWTLADEIARGEGFAHGGGLQKRAGEIMGVGEAHASKMYKAFGLADAMDISASRTS